ncbi:MAG: UDP-N-acetylmuramoyl-tripeptide--D-alanyl-D-alanine ligase [Ruminococcaceae bacterium]|nr:UDP-N-acetylmuramoyl-tripeptide--D-alanyl-D-alanine ligase [Oscillospiraceae bacterium]
MPYITFAMLLIVAASGIFSLYRQLQMLQQNSYFPSRYFKWLKESYTLELAISAILYCAITVGSINGKAVLSLVLAGILLALRITLNINTHKKSIKKLVFTARIKRLYITAIVLLGVLVLIPAIFIDALASEICRTLCLVMSIVTPILTFVIWIITYPIEKAISKWYINDAKKILKAHKNLTVIGITGSYGKTTTKFILNRILSEKFNTVCTPQSFNTPMGVVRTVRGNIKPQTQMFVCEMGAKNVGDIKEICDIANPDYAIITSVGEQHLETFKTVDNVFKTKFELADSVAKKGGITLANLDSAGIKERSDTRDDVIYFGDGTKYAAKNVFCSEDGTTFDLCLDGTTFTVSTRLLGLHSVSDILAAAAMAHILGVSENDIKFAIGSLKPTEHRLELKSYINASLLIDDAYNSNPEGCLEAVRVLGSFAGKRKILVTPGLIELGDREYDCNYALGLEATKYADVIILVGQNRSKPMMDAIATTDFNQENVYVVSSFKEATEIYTPMLNRDSVVLWENDLPDNYLK